MLPLWPIVLWIIHLAATLSIHGNREENVANVSNSSLHLCENEIIWGSKCWNLRSTAPVTTCLEQQAKPLSH
uniref:Secreted protein n=1 Tax=Anguilla anguilla TaxID=7936 RepID=A0A0E9S6D2_ANGAN